MRLFIQTGALKDNSPILHFNDVAIINDILLSHHSKYIHTFIYKYAS